MTTNLRSKKASSAKLLVPVIIASIVMTSLFGTILTLDNQAGPISYEEALQAAEAIPEIALFLEKNEQVNVTAELVNGVWIVEYSLEVLNFTENEYTWMNYVYVEVDAYTGKVRYYVVRSPNEPLCTEEQILAIAENDPEIVSWKNIYWFVYPTVWFDGYEYWYVTYLHNETGSSALVVISDLNQSIIDTEIYYRYPGATHTLQEMIDYAEEQPEVIAWKANNPDYYTSGIYTQNRWRINFGSDNNIIHGTTDWLYLLINDSTLEVFELKYRLWEPIHSEQEAIDIAMNDSEVAAIIATFSYNIRADWYDSGYWYVDFSHTYIRHKEVQVKVDDHLGTVDSYIFNNVSDPVMSYQEALNYSHTIDEVVEWLAFGYDYIEGLYYYYNEFYDGGLWNYRIYADSYTNGTGYPMNPNDTLGYYIQFDDLTQEIVYMIQWLNNGTEILLIDKIS